MLSRTLVTITQLVPRSIPNHEQLLDLVVETSLSFGSKSFLLPHHLLFFPIILSPPYYPLSSPPYALPATRQHKTTTEPRVPVLYSDFQSQRTLSPVTTKSTSLDAAVLRPQRRITRRRRRRGGERHIDHWPASRTIQGISKRHRAAPERSSPPMLPGILAWEASMSQRGSGIGPLFVIAQAGIGFVGRYVSPLWWIESPLTDFCSRPSRHGPWFLVLVLRVPCAVEPCVSPVHAVVP